MSFFYAINVLLCTLAGVRIVNCAFPSAVAHDYGTAIQSTRFTGACYYRHYKPLGGSDLDTHTPLMLKVKRRKKSEITLGTIVSQFANIGVNSAGYFFPPIAVLKSVYDEFFNSDMSAEDMLGAAQLGMIELARDVTRSFQVHERQYKEGDIMNRVESVRQHLLEQGIRLLQLDSPMVKRSGVKDLDLTYIIQIFNDLFREMAAHNDIYLIFIDKVIGWMATPFSGPTVEELIELEARFNLLPMYVEILFLVGFQTVRIHCHIRNHTNCNYIKKVQKNRIEKVIQYGRNVFAVIGNAHRWGSCAKTFDVRTCTINKKIPHPLVPVLLADHIYWEGSCDCQMDKYIEADSCVVEYIISFRQANVVRVNDHYMMSQMGGLLKRQQSEYLEESQNSIIHYWTVTVMLLHWDWRDTLDADIANPDLASRDEVSSAQSDVSAEDPSDADKKEAQGIIEKLKKEAKDIVNNSIKADRVIEKHLESMLKKAAAKTKSRRRGEKISTTKNKIM